MRAGNAGACMYDSLIHGALAGYAIAIPVGAIAVLILETGLRRGFWHAFAAGSGTATADLFYAALAATVGAFVATWLAPIAIWLKIVSAAFLIGLGGIGLYKAWGARRAKSEMEGESVNANVFKTYVTLLGLTILNPATIAYFAALILGGSLGTSPSLTDKIEFVVGAFLASWSWQSLLAVVSALAHRHLPASFRVWTSLVGNVIIVGLGIKILF